MKYKPVTLEMLGSGATEEDVVAMEHLLDIEGWGKSGYKWDEFTERESEELEEAYSRDFAYLMERLGP